MSTPRSDRLSTSRVFAHLAVMMAVAAVLGVVVAGLAIPFAGIAGLGARSVADTMDNLPAELETEALPQKTTITDVDGNTIATLYDENRVEVPLRQISRTMVKSIVSIEDYRFYQHGALDVKGTLRALITNQANSGTVQGGSSITQQLVKLTLLSQARTKAQQRAATEESYERKLRELRYAIAVEQRHSKDWILERYLNIAYFGDGAYGVQAAAKHYFNVNARDLNLPQSAMLAGLVKNPTGYDPTNAPDRALERRNVVLDRMAELQVITERKAENTKKQDLGLDPQPTSNGCVYSAAPFFCDYVLSYLMKDPALGKSAKERKRLLYAGGLTIRTTIDLADQQAADASVSSHVDPQDTAIGALALVEPGTGEVRAVAQSRPMGRNKALGETYLNYIVPQEYGDSAGFQPGSTFKAFVLAAAIEQGIPLTTRISSPQTISLDQDTFKVCGGGYYPVSTPWTPSNSTGYGTFDLYSGTRESVNTFYAQLEQRTGLCDPFRLARKMGIELTDKDTEMVPSFTLGVASVSPLEMAEAYATFAARGLHCKSRPVTAIEDANGTIIKSYPAQCRQVMEASTADAVNDVLRGVQEPGGFGYGAGLGLDQDSAAKTGTTDSNMSVWYVGYTANLAGAAMVAGANADGGWVTLNGQVVGGSPIYSAFGSTVAGPIWGDAMQVIDDTLEDEEFVSPSADSVAGVITTVPSVAGMSVGDAQRALIEAGFTPSVGGPRPSGYAAGTVAYTSPGAGASIPSSTSVFIYTSTGNPPRSTGGGGGGGGGNGDGTGDGRGNGGRGNGGR